MGVGIGNYPVRFGFIGWLLMAVMEGGSRRKTMNSLELDRLKSASIISKKDFKVRIKECKARLHKEYVKHNRKKFWIIDLLFLACILFNVGALVMTNMLVMKAQPTKVLVEANPVQAGLNDYQTNSAAQAGFFMVVLKQMLIWTGLIIGFLWYRRNIVCDDSWWIVLCIIIYYSVMTGLDFFNNLGFLIGKTLYGG